MGHTLWKALAAVSAFGACNGSPLPLLEHWDVVHFTAPRHRGELFITFHKGAADPLPCWRICIFQVQIAPIFLWKSCCTHIMCSQTRGPHTKRSTLTLKVQNYIGRSTMFPYPGYFTRMFALNFVVPALVNTWNPQIQPPALILCSYLDQLL